MQLCNVKDDTYFCLEHGLEYLQERKASQRKHCILYYTHSKEEISALIRGINQRLDNSDDDESDSDVDVGNDGGGATSRRISELAKMQLKRPKTPPPRKNSDSSSSSEG